MLNEDLLTGLELRTFETQIDGRFEAIAAQFVETDERFIALGERLDRISDELHALERRSELRCKAVERRLEATWAQIDHVRLVISARIEAARRDVVRIVLLGLLGTVGLTGMLCCATILLGL